jgi:hypothetical protein
LEKEDAYILVNLYGKHEKRFLDAEKVSGHKLTVKGRKDCKESAIYNLDKF